MTRPQGTSTQEAAQEVSRLFAAFSVRHLADPAAAQVVYVDRLRQLPARLLTAAINRVLERDGYLPTIAEVFDHARAIDREQQERATTIAVAQAESEHYARRNGTGAPDVDGH